MSTCFPSLTGVATRILIPRVAPTKGGPLKPDMPGTIDPRMLRPEAREGHDEWRAFAKHPLTDLCELVTEIGRRPFAKRLNFSFNPLFWISPNVLNPLIPSLNLEPKVQVLALIDQAIKPFSPRHCTTQLPPAQEGKLCLWAKAAKRAAQTSGKKKKKIHQTSQNYTELLCPKLLCMLHTYTTLPFGFGRTDKRPVPHKDSPEPFSPQHQIWSLISTSGMGSRSLCKFKRYSGYLALAQSLRVSFSPGVGRLTNLGLAHFGSDFRNVRRAWRPFCIQFPGWWEWHDIRDKLTHFTTTLS